MKLTRTMLTAWLIAPLVIVGVLWVLIDRNAMRRDRAAGRASPAVVRAGDYAAQPAGALPPPTGSNDKQGAAPVDDADLVHPEFLNQGVLLIVKDRTGAASAEKPIHFAGNWNAWSAAEESYKLSLRPDLRWQIVIRPGAIRQPLQFRFTRGASDKWECNTDYSPLPPRTLPKVSANQYASGERPVIELEIVAWEDQNPDLATRTDTGPYFVLGEGVTGTIKRVQVSGGGVWGVRDLLVWLPPGYDKPENSTRTYPVLYLHDGQHAFVKLPPATGEWEADETATKLIAEGKIEPLIIVGVPCHSKQRASEYSPIEIVPGVPPRGEQYAKWFVAEVTPRVERAFRVKQGPEHAAVGGAGLGAVIALELAQKHPVKFGKVLLESYVAADPTGAAAERALGAQAWPARVVLGVGGKESDDAKRAGEIVKATAAIEAKLKERTGTGAVSVTLIAEPDARGDEQAWSARLGRGLEALFPPSGNTPKSRP